jgi:hypothetical protein
MLYNLVSDPGEEKNVAAQHPEILHKMVAAYAQFAKNVGVVIPWGEAYANSAAHVFPPIDVRNPVSINLKQKPAIPGITSNSTASYHNQTKTSAPQPTTTSHIFSSYYCYRNIAEFLCISPSLGYVEWKL